MPRKRKAKSKNYFTQDTENAIVLYNSISDTDEKSKIYEKEIHYPFFKLTENIIHTFKFYYTEANEYSVDIKVILDLFFPTALFWSTVSVKGLVSISKIKPL
jgi:hypothetical protein